MAGKQGAYHEGTFCTCGECKNKFYKYSEQWAYKYHRETSSGKFCTCYFCSYHCYNAYLTRKEQEHEKSMQKLIAHLDMTSRSKGGDSNGRA